MRDDRAKRILADVDHYVHQDRVFMNNPAVMQGMGLAPLVVMATTGRKAAMLAAAVALLLIPTRILCSLLLGKVKHQLVRTAMYCGVSALVYIGMRLALREFFGNDVLTLGVYLPLLVVDPLVVYRHGRVPEPLHKAVSKGLRITVGYALVLLLTGCLREYLALGTVFGRTAAKFIMLPLADSPAGGFILVGVLFAVWRSCCTAYRSYVETEARKRL